MPTTTGAEPTSLPTSPQTSESSDASDSFSAAEPTGPSESREDRIREAAYASAERRGFEPGFEVEDWLEAERQIDQEPESPE